MAIYGIGARYDEDVYEDFIEQGCACVGWKEKVAPPAHQILKLLRTGDIIFIKSFPPQTGLIVKAVGVVLRGEVRDYGDLNRGVPVKWVWQGEERIGKLDDKWPVRTVTIYEEHNPRVHDVVLGLLFKEL